MKLSDSPCVCRMAVAPGWCIRSSGGGADRPPPSEKGMHEEGEDEMSYDYSWTNPVWRGHGSSSPQLFRGRLVCKAHRLLYISTPDSRVTKKKLLRGNGSNSLYHDKSGPAARMYGQYSIGPSIEPICTRCGFTKTRMIQVCSNFY